MAIHIGRRDFMVGFEAKPEALLTSTRELGSPDGDGGRHCERGDREAEVDPAPISLSSLGKHEKMDQDPETHCESQGKPN